MHHTGGACIRTAGAEHRDQIGQFLLHLLTLDSLLSRSAVAFEHRFSWCVRSFLGLHGSELAF
jgi:hypothetical protein